MEKKILNLTGILTVAFFVVLVGMTVGHFYVYGNIKALFTDDNFIKPENISTNSFKVSYDSVSYVLSYPFEHSIDRIIKIKNLKNEPIDINLKTFIFVKGKDEEVPGWPQPLPNRFEALEEKEIIFKYEFNNDIFSNSENGKTYDYPFKISVSLKDSRDSATQFSLSNKVKILGQEQNIKNLPTNSKISGNILDEKTNKPISNARVRIGTDLPIAPHEAQTNSAGFFSVSIPAYKRQFLQNWIQYSITIEKEGYENYNIALSPKEGEELKFEAQMKMQPERADYQLVTKYDTGLPTARVDFSKDGNYFATVPFHSSEKINVIKEKAYLHLFNSDGKLVCRYKLDNEIPTVSISDNGSLIATAYRPSIDRWDGGDDVLLLDKNCKELWRYSKIRTNDSGPSEVRISHNGKYIAVGTYNGRLFLLDVQNKKALWNVSTNNGQVRYILFNEDDSGVFFGSDPNLFHYKINGNLDWKTNIGAWPYSMALSNNYVFVGVKAGRFISLINKHNGDILWRYPIDARPDNMLISPDETYFIYQSSNGGLAIKNAFFDVSGNLLFNLQGANAGAITNDSKYIAYYNGDSVHLVNRRGHQLWQQQLDPEKWPSPRGAVSISNDKKKIIVADAVNGNVYFFQGGISNGSSQNPVAQKQESANINNWKPIVLALSLFLLVSILLMIFFIRKKGINNLRKIRSDISKRIFHQTERNTYDTKST